MTQAPNKIGDPIQALRALVDRIDEINKHPDFHSVFFSAYVHGVKYTGPTWNEPLTNAKAALAALESTGGHEHQ